jgi:ATP-binding cassette, subfamily G (WHITE), member 2, SNQ2
MLFKRGARAPIVGEAQEKADEERGAIKVDSPSSAEEKMRNDSGDSIAVPMMSDVFTWRNLEYDVSLKHGETRRLLADVSGFVAPGKLTALMGESGAGKVRTGSSMWRGIVLIYSSCRQRCLMFLRSARRLVSSVARGL